MTRVPYRLGDLTPLKYGEYVPPSGVLALRPSPWEAKIKPMSVLDDETGGAQLDQTKVRQALAVGTGGIGIGLMVILALGALFLLSHSGRRR